MIRVHRMRLLRVVSLVMVLSAASSGCRETRERNRGDFERMRRQQRYDPYAASGFFADGMTMRVPPKGTISREEVALGEAAATGVTAGRFVANIPVARTPALIATGERDFRIYCAPCHGTDASGRSVVAGNMRDMPPPSLLTDSVRTQADGRLFDVISHGKHRMPPYGWALPAIERWAVIAYLRSLPAGKE
jgi:mono/diheme cytochrome c family protein